MNQQPGQANESDQDLQLGLEPHDLECNWELHVGKFPILFLIIGKPKNPV